MTRRDFEIWQMRDMTKRIGMLFFVLLSVSIAPFASAQQPELSTTIRPVDEGVEFVLTNNSDKPVTLLRWETPLEPELTQDVFHVSSSDFGNKSLHRDRALFSGRLIRRANPKAEDFVEIAAGQSLSSVVRLADYYQLEDSGMHYVSYRGVLNIQKEAKDRIVFSSIGAHPDHPGHAGHAGLQTVYAKTGTVEVDLTQVPEVLYARAEGYTGCTAQQMSELPGDFDASEQITREAREALQGLPENERAGSPRYLQWFGEYESSRYAEALDTYVKSEDLMGRGEVEFDCSCDEPFYAFIRRSEPFRVNLCVFYWSAARLGTDSRAGTILHEVSHFDEIGGTEDHAYGASLVSSLALTSPSMAVNNADSIEYFAENTPFREISAGIVDGPVTEAPPEPQPPASISILQAGISVSSTIARDAVDLYQVSNADEVILNTINGDADLYVFSDAGFSQQICESIVAGGEDSCTLNTTDTVYIAVYGYRASTYSLVAESESGPLLIGQSQAFIIDAGAQQYFTVTGANFVQVNSVSGDSDLYVYSDPSRSGDTLVCDSRNVSSANPLDTCEIDGTAYVTVFGISNGQFSITSSLDNPVAPTVEIPVIDTPVVVIPDVEVPVDGTPVATGPIVIPQTGGSAGGSAGGGGQFSALFTLLLLVPLWLRRQLSLTIKSSGVRTFCAGIAR